MILLKLFEYVMRLMKKWFNTCDISPPPPEEPPPPQPDDEEWQLMTPQPRKGLRRLLFGTGTRGTVSTVPPVDPRDLARQVKDGPQQK